MFEGVRGVWVVRVGGDDGELRPWRYIYVYSIESRRIMKGGVTCARRSQPRKFLSTCQLKFLSTCQVLMRKATHLFFWRWGVDQVSKCDLFTDSVYARCKGAYATTLQGYLAHKTPPPLTPYSRAMSRALWGSQGGGRFLWARYPCTCCKCGGVRPR